MGQITLLSPTTDASVVIADASRYKFVTVSADAIGVASVAIHMLSGGVAVVVADPVTGTAMTLSATTPAVQLAGGVVYQLTKSITVANCGLFMDTGPGIQS